MSFVVIVLNAARTWASRHKSQIITGDADGPNFRWQYNTFLLTIVSINNSFDSILVR